MGTARHAAWVHSTRSRSGRFCCVRFGRPLFLGVAGPPSTCRAEGQARARGADTCPLVLVPVLLPACPGRQGPHHPAASLPCGSGSVQATRQPRGRWAGLSGAWGVGSPTSPQAHVSSAPAQASSSVPPIGAPAPSASCRSVVSVSWCSWLRDTVPPLLLSLSCAHCFENTPFVQLFWMLQLVSCREPDIHSQAASKFMNSFLFQGLSWVR